MRACEKKGGGDFIFTAVRPSIQRYDTVATYHLSAAWIKNVFTCLTVLLLQFMEQKCLTTSWPNVA